MSLFKMSGVQVPHIKNTVSLKAERVPAPSSVTLPVLMNIGTAAKPVVKAGDSVQVGQLIAESTGLMSSPVYATVSGKVKKIEKIVAYDGNSVDAILIESDGNMTVSDTVKAPVVTNYAEFIEAVRNSGLVGLGGAGFPTAAKLNVKDLSAVKEILINGAECEPYITSDARTMIDRADEVKAGIELLKKYMNPEKIIVGIKKSNPEALKTMTEVLSGIDSVSVQPLKELYPQGAEKVLIHTLTGKIVPEGKLPIDVGCIVVNVTTVAVIAQYIQTGMPLVEKCITIDGTAVAAPKNVIAPIGMALSDVFEAAGGFKCEPKKVLFGGPMVGVAVPDLAQPVLKNINALTAFAEKEANRPDETSCIHCGSCVNSCPLNLNPIGIAKALDQKDFETLEALKVNLCMACGCCSFICPAKRNIVAINKLAKAKLREHQEKEAANAAEKEAK